MIIQLIALYRAWYCIQPGGARTTPGSAVGLLFIPLFSIYWIFVAYNGLAEDWNRVMNSHEDLGAAPRLSQGLFLWFCIGMLLGFGIFLLFPVMSQLCNAINFFAYRRKPSTSALTGFGGLKFH